MLALFLMSFISSCSRTVKIEPTPVIQVVCGNPDLLAETPLPAPPPKTTQGLVDYMIALDERMRQCNADKKAFRQMMDDLKLPEDP